jgi:hypothetical protein
VITDAFNAGVFGGYEWPFAHLDLRVWLFAEAQRWRQQIERAEARYSTVFGTGVGTGVRVPMTAALFVQAAREAAAFVLPSGVRGGPARSAGTG